MMSDPTFRSDFHVELTDHMGDDMTPVRLARASTGTEVGKNPKADLGLLNYLMRDGHHVPFEGQVMTFFIEAPIFVTRQLLKHRISSISEESGRYRELEGVFYIPPASRPVKQVGKTGDYQFERDRGMRDHAAAAIEYASAEAWGAYRLMLKDGVAKEVARMALPVNLYSRMYLTINSRSLFNFFKLRLSSRGSHPQWEIEQVALGMWYLWWDAYPETRDAFVKHNPIRKES